MKTSIIFLQLLLLTCFCYCQKLGGVYIDTLQKNSTHIVVGEINAIYPGIDLNISQTHTTISFKPIEIWPQEILVDYKISLVQGQLGYAECIQKRKYFNDNDSTSFPLDEFKKGDTCIIFLKYIYDPQSNKAEAYFSIVNDTSVFYYDKEIIEYIAGIRWNPYKEYQKCKFISPPNNTSYWCLRLQPAIFSENGVLLYSNTIKHKKARIIKTSIEFRIDGTVEKKTIRTYKKVNPFLRRKKYPKYNYGFYVKGVTKNYNGDGGQINKIRDNEIVWCGQEFGSKF